MRRAFSLAEILIAVTVMVLGVVVVQSSSVRGVGEAAWGAEKVLAEGLAAELVTFYRSLDPCNVAARAEVAPSEAAVTAAHRSALEAVPALAGDGVAPVGSAIATEYAGLRRARSMERHVCLDAAKKELVCVVRWSSAAGQSVRIERRFPLECTE